MRLWWVPIGPGLQLTAMATRCGVGLGEPRSARSAWRAW